MRFLFLRPTHTHIFLPPLRQLYFADMRQSDGIKRKGYGKELRPSTYCALSKWCFSMLLQLEVSLYFVFSYFFFLFSKRSDEITDYV